MIPATWRLSQLINRSDGGGGGVHPPGVDPDEIVIDDGAMQPHARATRAGHAETRFPALDKCHRGGIV